MICTGWPLLLGQSPGVILGRLSFGSGRIIRSSLDETLKMIMFDCLALC